MARQIHLSFTLLLLVGLAVAPPPDPIPAAGPVQAFGSGSPHAVAIGSTVELICKATITKWEHVTTKTEQIVSSDRNGRRCLGSLAVDSALWCRGDVVIDTEAGTSIRFQSVRMEDAGKYICTKANGQTETIELTVFADSTLRFTFNTDSDEVPPVIDGKRAVYPDEVVFLVCDVVYSGFKAPEVEMTAFCMKDADPEMTEPFQIPDYKGGFHREARGGVTAVLNKRNRAETGVWCTMPNALDNAPSDIFMLVDGPRFLKNATRQNTVYKKGADVAELDCQTDSYPNAVYLWSFVDDNSTFMVADEDGPVLVATMVGQYWCSATNTANNRTIEKVFNVEAGHNWSPNTWSIILPLSGILLVVMIIVFVFICKTDAGRQFCRCCFRTAHGDRKQRFADSHAAYMIPEHPCSLKYAEFQNEPTYDPPTDEIPPPYMAPATGDV